MSPDFLQSIERPDDLRALSSEELAVLCRQIRERMITATSQNGGHLASSLGAVEIIIALHRVFDFSSDRLVFDVGHQSYAHKIITGRNESFETLRKKGGISGFPKRSESIFDAHDAGHASDSLSIAAGLAFARDLSGGYEEIVALIGDASLSGGVAFEALNQIGHDKRDMTIVLNDNEMSISKNVGALSLYLGKARMSKPYTLMRDTVEGSLAQTGRVGKALVDAGEAAKNSFKKLMVPGMFFEDMGIKYIGPIDGHDIESMEEALLAARKVDGPVLIHAITQKGKGYAPAETLPEVYHGVGCFDPYTGVVKAKSCNPTYTEVMGDALVREAAFNETIVAITAGMTSGTGLGQFSRYYPERFVDVGIAEEHAVALAAGLALGNKRPVVAIYSTFLQRSYDQIAMDVALQDLPVIFCVDRAGLVGEDGSTHQGAFDIAYLRSIPGMRIIAPYTAADVRRALRTALSIEDGPVAIRYPRGATPDVGELDGISGSEETGFEQSTEDMALLPYGRAKKLQEGKDVALLALGSMVSLALECAKILAQHNINALVYDMLWVKPLDTKAIEEAAKTQHIITLENGTLDGGFGSAVMEELVELHLTPQVQTFGLPDAFVEHGSQDELLAELGLTAQNISNAIIMRINEA